MWDRIILSFLERVLAQPQVDAALASVVQVLKIVEEAFPPFKGYEADILERLKKMAADTTITTVDDEIVAKVAAALGVP